MKRVLSFVLIAIIGCCIPCRVWADEYQGYDDKAEQSCCEDFVSASRVICPVCGGYVWNGTGCSGYVYSISAARACTTHPGGCRATSYSYYTDTYCRDCGYPRHAGNHAEKVYHTYQDIIVYLCAY